MLRVPKIVSSVPYLRSSHGVYLAGLCPHHHRSLLGREHPLTPQGQGSATEAIHYGCVMAIPETSVLRPKDASAPSPDDWPVFSLRDVNVVSRRSRCPISLLAANKQNPVTVTGRLSTIDHDLMHLGMPHFDNHSSRVLLNNTAIQSKSLNIPTFCSKSPQSRCTHLQSMRMEAMAFGQPARLDGLKLKTQCQITSRSWMRCVWEPPCCIS